ncbi:hypothetical protein DEU56DRAFT_841887 [Suillus clintonianus]|uniref:uncharacterized protein n=1 Tax=Suillus clintonianus TaxID=1904413 RepID=UPI001B86A797|nr:uncharacterized protein DEU56DRAFT_841887 [Suillus clintonianus]KAG2114541.1 hypothetical protein DEU56DRAFT_841887 [Suillus clintonianus]
MHASNVVETCDSTNASTSQDDSELSSPVPHTTPPSTPPRGRTRYPDSLARVPLHRRGTSKTYERLEDLLREAGYKETRVFTPESERHNDHTTDRHASSVRGGVGAVVGFLAGLVSRNSSMAREPISNKDSLSPRSQPPSPLAHIQGLHPSSSTSQSASSYSFNTSPESLRKHSRFHATHARRNVFPETHGQPRPPNSHYMRHQSSSNFSRDAPNAHAYLRHMASAPNIQPLAKRPSSSNVSLRSHRNPQPRPRPSRRSLLLSADDIIETDDPPPLPSNWMESVAKALLSGVVPDTASTRKTSSTFSDATNKPREQRRPPLLCAQVRDQRANRIEGKVSQTNVMCRSAPASRAGSRVRRTGAEDEGSGHRRDDERRRKNKRDEESRKGKGKRKESDMVPSLARTRVENDEWSMSRYLPASHRQEGPSSSSSSSEDMDDDEEEDEGELDLERLLVPARRQASIRSLRKHLHPPTTTGSLRGLPPTSPSITTASTSIINGQLSPFAPDSRQHIWLDDSWGTGRGRRWVVGEEDDEGDGYGNGAFSASETGSGTSTRTRAGMKRRRGLPGAWAQWGA